MAPTLGVFLGNGARGEELRPPGSPKRLCPPKTGIFIPPHGKRGVGSAGTWTEAVLDLAAH